MVHIHAEVGALVRSAVSTRWLWLVVCALPACQAVDAPVSEGRAPQTDAQIATGLEADANGQTDNTAPIAVTVVAPVNSLEAGTHVGEHPAQGSQNRFPADFGPHPQFAERDGRTVVLIPNAPGSDLRPHETKLSHLNGAPAGLLVLYDSTSTWGWLGELYGMCAIILASHFGTVDSKPVALYAAGDMDSYKGVIYVGSTFDEPLPVSFLDDVLEDTKPVLWISSNLWQLVARAKDFQATYGFSITWFDTSKVAKVVYKSTDLKRDANNASGLVQVGTIDPAIVTTLATAVRDDGTTLPWAVRALNLTYVVENPFGYIGPDDRYIAYCDLLFEVFAPQTPIRHRGLVRLEDVNPSQDPVEFRAIVDFLHEEKVPFSIALIPMYVDALGAFNNGVPQILRWKDRPAMLAAIKYATVRGGTIVMHGYTHQFEDYLDPYSGVSADDFEFYMTHVDANNYVIYDGPVPGDSAELAWGRIYAGLAELKAAGLQAPTIFEYPHYAGSAVDSKAIQMILPSAYHRGLFFAGDLGINPPDFKKSIGLFYPFTVTDVYGWKIMPENLGNYEPEAYNNHPPRLPADLIASAKNNLVIRDGVASFFFHPYYPLDQLKLIVKGVKATGYTFVSAAAMMEE